MDNSIFPFVEVDLEWAAHHQWQAGDAVARGAMRAYTLWLVLSGELDVNVAGHTRQITEGTLLLLPPHLNRELSTKSGADWLSVGIIARIFGRVDLLQHLEVPAQWTPPPAERDVMAMWMCQIVAEWVEVATPEGKPVLWKSPRVPLRYRQPRDAVSSFISAGLGHALVGMCWRMLNQEAVKKNERVIALETPSWLPRTIEQITREPGTAVNELARNAGFSPAQFRRNFHTWVGTSPQTYITQRRMEEARRLLIVTDLTVDLVAQKVGFESASYFTRLFKKRFGAAPARFRQMSRYVHV
ncbi:MAG: helix-turn-helix transcriptional regulator [Fibrella sp.]|nr:helix-turn-helix transcriptional regulator [Armatimonadota bacterium]